MECVFIFLPPFFPPGYRRSAKFRRVGGVEGETLTGEFFQAMLGEEAYELAIKHKMAIYAQNRLNVISIYPQTFETDWQDYVLGNIRKNLVRRMIDFEEKDRHYQRI